MEDLHKQFGRDTAVGRAVYNIYNKRIMDPTPPAPTPAQKPFKQEDVYKAAPRSKTVVNVPRFGRRRNSDSEAFYSLASRKKPADKIFAENPPVEPPRVPANRKFPAPDERKRHLQEIFEKYGTATAKPEATASLSSSPEELLVKDLDEIDQLVNEIDERRQFLEDMRRLGCGQKYEAQIRSEISQRVVQLERLKL